MKYILGVMLVLLLAGCSCGSINGWPFCIIGFEQAQPGHGKQ